MRPNLSSLARPMIFLVLFNILPQIGLRPTWAVLLAFVLVGYRLWADFANLAMPPRLLLWVGQIMIGVAVWAHYHTLLGDEAGGTLLTLLTCVKIYELRTRRDYFIATMFCVLTLMSYLLLDQGLMVTGFFLMDMVLIVAFLLALQAGGWQWVSWRATLRPGFMLLVKSLPLLLVTFLLFPRFSTGFGPGTNNIGQTGMSDTLSPGSIAKLIASDDVVFRATFLNGDMPPATQVYWRGAVLDVSEGLNWKRSAPRGRSLQPAVTFDRPNVEIYLEPGEGRFLFTSELTDQLGFPNEANRVSPRPGNVYELVEPLLSREHYYLQKGPDERPEPSLQTYLQTSEPPSEELAEFLKKFSGRPAKETVHDLLEHFRTDGFLYSLQPPPSTSIETFLFKTKVGFCEHYAGTLATLLRYLHVPSRVVVGFQGGTPSILDNYLSVRGHDAHAWVEYYDDAVNHWRRVDPTAQVAPLRLAMGGDSYFRAGHGGWSEGWTRFYMRGRAFMEQVESSWVGFLLHFDLARQRELLAKFGMAEALSRALPFFLALAIVLTLAFYYFIGARRRERFSAEEQLYRQFLMQLRRWRVGRAPQDGPLAIMHKIRKLSPEIADRVEPWFSKMVQMRFGAHEVKPADLMTMRAELRQIRKLKRPA